MNKAIYISIAWGVLVGPWYGLVVRGPRAFAYPEFWLLLILALVPLVAVVVVRIDRRKP